ncbi:MAG: N-acetyl-D-Glu racemase DgcA [Vibrio sp.]
MNVSIIEKSWPIRGSFTISRGSKTQADTLIVQLEREGIVARGECVPYARYGESIESVRQQIESVRTKLEQDLSRERLQTLLPSGAARNAVDCALWDLECKRMQQSVWERLEISPEPVITAFTLSLDTPENMELAAKDNAHRPLLKLKLGGAGDLARVEAVRRGAPQARIILDANEAWSIDDYHRLVPQLVKLDVEMIEQPFPADDDAVLATLDRPIPICADESCHDRASLPKLANRYDMINIKTDKTGGLTEALALKDEALAAGFAVMVGCMLSSSLSMAPAFIAAQQVAVVDLDGPLLLSQDIEHGFTFEENAMMPFTTKLWG